MWRHQKESALAALPVYAYAVGPGYDRIPADVVVNGFPFAHSDLGHIDIISNDTANVHLPVDRLNLGRYGTNPDWCRDGGYGVMSPHNTMVHLAPIFPNLPSRGLGDLAGMKNGMAWLNGWGHQSHGHHLQGGAPSRLVRETTVHQRNANNPVGMLTAAAPEVTPKGYFSYFMGTGV